MKNLKMRRAQFGWIAASAVLLFGTFQNCAAPVQFEDAPATLGSLGVCEGVSCDLTPLTSKAAVTTILVALGDEADDQLVVNGASAQLVAETVIRYTSPKSAPRILMVRDSGSGSESAQDPRYVLEKLLNRYDVTQLDEPKAGLKDSDLEGYDIVWFNNPGAPMGVEATRDTLIRFKGGVILQGDDLSYGKNFSNEALTGLKYIDNGTSVKCGDGKSYDHDGNTGEKYRVTLDVTKIPGADSGTIAFRYGNDIDNTIPARPDLEVLATARGGPVTCTESRPVIVRYFK